MPDLTMQVRPFTHMGLQLIALLCKQVRGFFFSQDHDDVYLLGSTGDSESLLYDLHMTLQTSYYIF